MSESEHLQTRGRCGRKWDKRIDLRFRKKNKNKNETIGQTQIVWGRGTNEKLGCCQAPNCMSCNGAEFIVTVERNLSLSLPTTAGWITLADMRSNETKTKQNRNLEHFSFLFTFLSSVCKIKRKCKKEKIQKKRLATRPQSGIIRRSLGRYANTSLGRSIKHATLADDSSPIPAIPATTQLHISLSLSFSSYYERQVAVNRKSSAEKSSDTTGKFKWLTRIIGGDFKQNDKQDTVTCLFFFLFKDTRTVCDINQVE